MNGPDDRSLLASAPSGSLGADCDSCADDGSREPVSDVRADHPPMLPLASPALPVLPSPIEVSEAGCACCADELSPAEPEDAGERTDAPPAQRFRVEGMDCGACARTLERAVGALPGATSVRVSFGGGTMEVDGDVATEAVVAAVSVRAIERGTRSARPPSRRLRSGAVTSVRSLPRDRRCCWSSPWQPASRGWRNPPLRRCICSRLRWEAGRSRAPP